MLRQAMLRPSNEKKNASLEIKNIHTPDRSLQLQRSGAILSE